MLTMSTRIRRSRLAAKLSQAQLAALTGVQRSAVAQWEREENTHPSIKHLALVAVATAVRFEWLATGRGPAHAKGSEFEVVADFTDFAHDQTETQVLEFVRRLSPQKQKLACRLLEVLVTP